MDTTEKRLEYAMQALKAIATMGTESHALCVAVARVTIDKIAVKTTDFWPAGREKEAAAYNARYEPKE